MVVETRVAEKPKIDVEPKFRAPSTLTEEQLTDPDYSIKKIARDAGLDVSKMLVCSKCHHCR